MGEVLHSIVSLLAIAVGVTISVQIMMGLKIRPLVIALALAVGVYWVVEVLTPAIISSVTLLRSF